MPVLYENQQRQNTNRIWLKEADWMKKIVIPIDGSEFSERAMKKGKEFAENQDYNIVLVTVVNYTFPIFPVETTDYAKKIYNYKYSLSAKMKESAEEYLKKGKESFGELSGKVETVLLEGNPAEKILEYLDTDDIETDAGDQDEIAMIIMGSSGISSSRVQRFILGSVTLKVLQYAKQPVLVVK